MSLRCAVLVCQAEIAVGEEYYLLGTRVVTCVPCATTRRYCITVNKQPLELERGWHLTPVKDKLLRRHV